MEPVNFQDWASARKIDPLLLELLQQKADLKMAANKKIDQTQTKPYDFPLITASYISVAVMVLIILLGLFRGKEINLILTNAFLGLIIFFGVGFCFGKILDLILKESSKTLIKEMLVRTETNVHKE